MSEIPERRYDDLCSADLDMAVSGALQEFKIEPYGEQFFSTESDKSIWLRFKNSALTDLITDISVPTEPFKVFINLSLGDNGYLTTETCLFDEDMTDITVDSYPSLLQVQDSGQLTHAQFVRITDVLDNIKEHVDGDVYDPAFESIVLAGSYIEEELYSPTKWQQRLNKARRSAGFVMVSLNQIDPNPVLVVAAASSITQ